MAENVIALVLPEYDDGGNVITSDDWKRNFLMDDVEVGKHIKELASFVDFFSDENCRMVYDGKNVSAFSYALRMLPECYPSRSMQLQTALKNASNWRTYRVSKEDEEFSVNYTIVRNETRCEMAALIAKDTNNSCIVVVHIPDYKGRLWRLSKREKEYEINSFPADISEVFGWLINHHKPARVYNWNPKHGENGCGAHKKHAGEDVSILLCSKEHAAELLPKAIGLDKWDSLYVYDKECRKFMEYKAECKYEHVDSTATERAYHSYHINSVDIIPNRVIRKMKALGIVSE